jgi:hypothetical protein
LGTITGDLGERLLDCIEQGHSYRAEIIEIDGRKCRVRITNRCLLNTSAALASPKPKAVSEITEGDLLSVQIRDGSLCVVDDLDRVVGSLAKPWTNIIIGCIESGMEYEAEVLDIDGGACEVNVQSVFVEE